MPGVFLQVIVNLSKKSNKSSAYRHQFLDVLGRFHSTLKSMIRTYCLDHEQDLDKNILYLMFAAHESV